MSRLAAAFRANSEFPLETAATFQSVPGVSWSDHRSFWSHGYRAMMVTDMAFYRYRHYHMPSDTPDKLAYPELTRVTPACLRLSPNSRVKASANGAAAVDRL
ncbi:M28 family peptidase [Methylocystis sp. FS]|nr:M28 family peptidase [Methylocystis silviterrae]